MTHLQSIVIVLLKVVLTNVTAIVTQANANGQSGLGPGFQPQENGRDQSLARTKSNANVAQQANGHNGPSQEPDVDLSLEELDNTRLREITGKAVSGSLLLLLKWFKISRTLPILDRYEIWY